jgi:hypothetical protein
MLKIFKYIYAFDIPRNFLVLPHTIYVSILLFLLNITDHISLTCMTRIWTATWAAVIDFALLPFL